MWNEKIGKQLERLVAQLGIPNGEFAKRLNVDPRTYFNWRSGKKPDARNRALLLAALGGADAVHWDDPRYLDLAVAIGARPEPDDPPSPPPEAVRSSARRRSLVVATAAALAFSLVVGWFVWGWFQLVAVVPSADGPWELKRVLRSSWVEPESRHGFLVWPERVPPVPRVQISNWDWDLWREGMVVSLDGPKASPPTGDLRVDCFGCRGSWPHYFDTRPVLGADTLEAASWNVDSSGWMDYMADGNLEVAVALSHKWFPSVLLVLNGKGERVMEFWNSGHIKDVYAVPAEFYAQLLHEDSIAIRIPEAIGSGPALALAVEWNDPPKGAGLIILPPGFEAGSYPTTDPRYQLLHQPILEDAIYIRLEPTAIAMSFGAKKNWPANIAYDPASKELFITTIEEPSGQGIVRAFNTRLEQVRVSPTSAFVATITELRKTKKDLPALDSEEMRASVETISYREKTEWKHVTRPDTWRP